MGRSAHVSLSGRRQVAVGCGYWLNSAHHRHSRHASCSLPLNLLLSLAGGSFLMKLRRCMRPLLVPALAGAGSGAKRR